MILAIDFDGTIVEHKYPEIGALKLNAKEVINKLCNEGYEIIIWTCRYTKKDILDCVNFLKVNGIKYSSFNENISGLSFSPFPKVYADVYIDDRNIMGIPNWEKIYQIITGKR